ncbi:MAG TPA: hypothetical protein VN736_15035 [Candidatus Limnocylindrales bacterium]|nr:hypothetical protein [Candidatus Limnocylindrales bacterium]
MLISEKPVKRVKAVIPPDFALDEPSAGEYESRLIGPDEVVSAFMASVDQAGAFEDSRAARNGGEEILKGLASSATERASAKSEGCGGACIGEGGEDGGGLCGLVNPVAKRIIESA